MKQIERRQPSCIGEVCLYLKLCQLACAVHQPVLKGLWTQFLPDCMGKYVKFIELTQMSLEKVSRICLGICKRY